MNKILFIFEDSRFGGPHEFTLNLIKNIKKKFICKIYLSDNECKIFVKKIRLKKINFNKFEIQLLTKSFFKSFKYLLNFFFDLNKILRVIKRENPNYVYIINGFYSLRTILACIILKKKIIFHFHDTYCNIIFYKLGFFLSKFAKCAIFSSSRSFNFYKNFFKKKKILIAQSGVNVVKSSKKQHSFEKKKFFNITTVSNINPVKNLNLFFETAKIINIPNIKFNLIGKVWSSQKEYYDILLKKYNLEINTKVRIFNNISNVKNFHIKKTDLYFCPSLFESSPVAVWEALSLGIPIISTNVGDLQSFNKAFNFGEITNSFSAKKMSDRIIKLYNNKKKIKKLSLNARKFAVKELDIKIISKKIEEFIINV